MLTYAVGVDQRVGQDRVRGGQSGEEKGQRRTALRVAGRTAGSALENQCQPVTVRLHQVLSIQVPAAAVDYPHGPQATTPRGGRSTTPGTLQAPCQAHVSRPAAGRGRGELMPVASPGAERRLGGPVMSGGNDHGRSRSHLGLKCSKMVGTAGLEPATP
jgi:hypothetical protein